MPGFEQLSELGALSQDRALLILKLFLAFTDLSWIFTDLAGWLALIRRDKLRLLKWGSGLGKRAFVLFSFPATRTERVEPPNEHLYRG